jgi:hypothetical protein
MTLLQLLTTAGKNQRSWLRKALRERLPKIGTIVGGLGVSDCFAVELMGTYAALGGRMSLPEL